MTNRATNVTRMVTMIWAFLLLSGLPMRTAAVVDSLPSIADAAQMRQLTTASRESTDGGGESWKSCVQLLHPQGNFTASKIEAMIETPKNISQFLQNLKIAADRGLLLQPAFYDEALLLKFFHASTVKFSNSNIYMDALSSGTEARIESDISPKLYVTLSNVCRVQKYGAADDTPGLSVSSDGFLTIGIGLGSSITLKDIRSVFGLEAQLHLAGQDPDFHGYLASDKGSALYETLHRPGIEDSRIQARFFLGKNHAGSLAENDVVKKVRLHDMQDHFYPTPMDSSTHAQNPTAVTPVQQRGGIEQWKSCAMQLHPEGNYAVSEIQAMFDSPKNIPQFLINLKIAADRHLTLQPSFYDEATLMKFFNGSKVTVEKLNSHFDGQSSGIDARIASDTFPTLAIHLRSICTVRNKIEMTNGSDIGSVDANGSLGVTATLGPLITLRDIRSVFGPEQDLRIDQGMDLDMNSYTPTYKGSVEYSVGRGPRISGIRTQIAIRKDGQRNWIEGSDVVKRLEMNDIQERTLESR